MVTSSLNLLKQFRKKGILVGKKENIDIELQQIEIAINNENRYSALPCPKLWSSSPGALAILLPIKVIRDANISPALFILSAIID